MTTLSSFGRPFRLTISAMLWRFMKPRADPVIISLNCKRIQLQASHRSTKAIEREMRARNKMRFMREQGRV